MHAIAQKNCPSRTFKVDGYLLSLCAYFRVQASGGFCRGWMKPHRTAWSQLLGGWLPSLPAMCACILRRGAFRWCKMASCSMLRRLCWRSRRPSKTHRSKSLLVLVRLAHGLGVLWWRLQTLSIPCWLRWAAAPSLYGVTFALASLRLPRAFERASCIFGFWCVVSSW